MPSKARKQEKVEAKKQEECPEQKANRSWKEMPGNPQKNYPRLIRRCRKRLQDDDAAGNLGKMREMMRTPLRKDAGRSPARTRCTERSTGKVVRRKYANFKFKNSTLANLRNFSNLL